jgi:hypothetical protein
MCLAGAAVADQDDIFGFGHELAIEQLLDECLLNGWLSLEVEAVNGLEDGELRGPDPPFHRPMLTLNHFPLGQAKQVGCIITVVFRTAGGNNIIFILHRRKLQKLQMLLQQHSRLSAHIAASFR